MEILVKYAHQKTSSPYSIKPHEGKVLEKLHSLLEVTHIEAHREWLREGIQCKLDKVAWDGPSPMHKRTFRLTITERTQESFQDTKMNLIEMLSP